MTAKINLLDRIEDPRLKINLRNISRALFHPGGAADIARAYNKYWIKQGLISEFQSHCYRLVI